MPRGPRGEKRPGDVVGCAVKVAKIDTGEVEEELPSASQMQRHTVEKTTIQKQRLNGEIGSERQNIPESLKRVHKNPEFWAMVKRGKEQIARGESKTVRTLDELREVIAARASKGS